MSLRYRRLGQIDEGYSIPLTPLEHLAQTVYADDPCLYFQPKTRGLRPDPLVARMHKAAAIMQFKLEGPLIARHPEWGLDHRRLLHRIDFRHGTVEVDGVHYALRDPHLPTVDPGDPYRLSAEEEDCLARLRHSFVSSQKLLEHMQYLVGNGSMYLRRDDRLIFHGCIPCDAQGQFLPMPIAGAWHRGRSMYDTLEKVVAWASRTPAAGASGRPVVPVERSPVAPVREGPHHDLRARLHCGQAGPSRNEGPLLPAHSRALVLQKVLEEFGVDPVQGLIVNGHVPVKIEEGESPLKRSGQAITIDGAFSEAYGDRGYTLVEESGRTLLRATTTLSRLTRPSRMASTSFPGSKSFANGTGPGGWPTRNGANSSAVKSRCLSG